MRALGVDPSSSATGLVVVEGDGTLVSHEQWRSGLIDTSDPKANAHAAHRLFQDIDAIVCRDAAIRFICVEQLASAQNLKTVRAIMYFEAAAMIAWSHLFHCGIEVHLLKPHVGEMRRRVFGNGGWSKEQCADIVRERLGMTEMRLPTQRSKKMVHVFTDDEADAYAYGCYAVDHRVVVREGVNDLDTLPTW